jgi:hypothetical protein
VSSRPGIYHVLYRYNTLLQASGFPAIRRIERCVGKSSDKYHR